MSLTASEANDIAHKLKESDRFDGVLILHDFVPYEYRRVIAARRADPIKGGVDFVVISKFSQWKALKTAWSLEEVRA